MTVWNLLNTLIIITLFILIILLWVKGHECIASGIICGIVGYYAHFKSVLARLILKHTFKPKDAVIITGCDSGLGYGLALHCQSLGAEVFAGVHNEHSPGAMRLKNSKINVLPLDVTIKTSLNIFCEVITRIIMKDNMKLKAVVNNVGVMVFGEFEWQTEDQISEQINVNLIGTMNVTQRLLPLIRSHKSRIIFVCSHCALEPLPGAAVYGATKAGILAYATSLRVELRKFKIPVISFVPGSFVSESNIFAMQKEHFKKMWENMSDEAKEIYGEYFNRHKQYLSPISQKVKVAKLSNGNIFRVFEGCIFDKYPAAIYKCEPWRYKMYHLLCKISPTIIRDLLIEKFVQMPKWNAVK